MKKIEDFLNKQHMTWRYSNDTVPLIARKSLKIGAGLTFLIVGLLFIYGRTTEHSNTYQKIATEPTVGLKQLSNIDENKEMLLVLYRPDCSDCKKVEQKLVKELRTVKEEKNIPVLAMDIKKMNENQLLTLKDRLPEIFIDGNKIPTPLVVNLKLYANDRISVTKKADTDYKKIQNVIHSL